MQWADLKFTVEKPWAELAQAVAISVSGSGIYVEDYADLADQAPQIAPVDFIDDALLRRQNDDVVIHLYLPPEQNIGEVVALLTGRMEEAGIPYAFEENTLRQEDWENSWKAYYHSMEVGRRLALCPAWETIDTQRAVLRLDPGMAFGTGTHETTYLCLEVLDALVAPGQQVLDIGCGSGVLGIAACLLGAQTAFGVDIDPVAVRTANENAALNGMEGRFQAVEGNLADQAHGRYHIVTANIIAKAIVALAPQIPPLLAENGVFVSSGIIDEKEQEVADAIVDAGMEIIEIRRKKGWSCILAKASSPA